MAQENRAMDQTRRLLKTFGVKLTDYEERTAVLLDGLDEAPEGERMRRAAEVLTLTEDLNRHVRNITNHVTETQNRVLSQVRDALAGAQSRG